jgi:putative phage-type endonuclease
MKIIECEHLSDQWFDERRNRVTATDIPKILGQSSWGTALEVWARITEKVPDERKAPTPIMEWGNRTEQMNRDWFSEIAKHDGNPLVVEKVPGLVQHPELDWLVATPDGVVSSLIDGEKALAPLGPFEGKGPSQWTRDDWAESVPIGYQIQVHGQMVCMGFETSFVSAIVQKDIQPEAVQFEVDRKVLERLHPLDNGGVVEMGYELVEPSNRYEEIAKEMKALKDEQEAIKIQIIDFIQDGTYGAFPSDLGMKPWKYARQERKAYSVPAKQHRVLRRVKAVS